MAISVVTDVTNANDNRTLSWSLGTLAVNDIIAVTMLTDEQSLMKMNAPTATGVTFTQRAVDSTGSHCWATVYTGIVNTGGAITVTSTPTTANLRMHGGVCTVFPTADGYSLAATPNTADVAATILGVPAVVIRDAAGYDIIGLTAPGAQKYTTLAVEVLQAGARSYLVVVNGDWQAVDGASRVYRGTVIEDNYTRGASAATFYFWHQLAVGTPNPAAFSPAPGFLSPPQLAKRVTWEWGAAAAGGPQNFQQALNAGVSFTGALTKATSYHLTAGLSFTGGFTKLTSHPLAGGLSFTGAQTRRVGKLLIAGLSFTGAQIRAVAKVMTAGLSFTGALTRVVAYHLTATLSFVGALTKRTTHPLTGGLSFTGSTTATIVIKRTLTAGLSFTGSLTTTVVHFFTQALTAGLSFTGGFTKRAGKALAGGLSFAGSQSRRIGKLHTAALSFTGALPRAVRKTITAGVSFAGTVVGFNPSQAGIPPYTVTAADKAAVGVTALSVAAANVTSGDRSAAGVTSTSAPPVAVTAADKTPVVVTSS